MPTYKLTLDATRYGRDARTFSRYVDAPTAQAARDSIGNRPVQDNTDMAWFDEWRITDTRKVDRYEVVTTDNRAWHSGGITGITVEYGKRAANARLRLTRKHLTPGQGAFIQPAH
jgi:hypothetical protein